MTAARHGRYHRYSVYGARITCQRRFDFPPAHASDRPVADVYFEEHGIPMGGLRDGRPGGWFTCRIAPERSAYLRWGDLYEFEVDPGGVRVVCHRLPGGSRAVLQNYLFGQVLSFALVRQRVEQLHASVVEIGGEAIGFLGDCTFGKSTLAASFLQAGHRLLTDDALTVDFRSDGPVALPGTSRIKLEPDAAAELLRDVEGVPLNPYSTKRCFLLPGDRTAIRALPLSRLFVLGRPAERGDIDSVEIQPLSGADAVRALLQHSFNAEVFDRARIQQQFGFAARVASSVATCTLRYPHGLDRLVAVRRAVVDDLAATSMRRPSSRVRHREQGSSATGERTHHGEPARQGETAGTPQSTKEAYS
jgi:hypothetical protein